MGEDTKDTIRQRGTSGFMDLGQSVETWDGIRS